MKKRAAALISLTLLLAAAGAAFLSSTGWVRGEDAVLDYVISHYDINGDAIVAGEHLESGNDSAGEYKTFLVATESGEHSRIRVNVRYRRHLLQIGPECRVLDIAALSDQRTAST